MTREVTVEIVHSTANPTPVYSVVTLPDSSESVFKGARTRLYNRLRRENPHALIVSVWTREELAEFGFKARP